MTELVGRAPELARLRALIEAAAGGRSGALALTGDAGIGKSALLDAAERLAAEHGATVLRARGVEQERGLPFAAVTELLGPVAGVRERLSPLHASVLGGALALEPAPASSSPFAVAVAFLAALGALADEAGALVVLVDDAHWLDQESLDAVLFAARRLEAEGVAIVVAARPEPDRGLAAAALELVEVPALDGDSTLELLRRAAPEPASERTLRELLDAAAGNPLAALELPRTLTAAQLAGTEPLPQPVRPGTTIERVFRRELEALDERTAHALLVAAADETLTPELIGAALARLGLDVRHLEPAERAGLVRLEPARVRFRHPLLRSVAYHRATAAGRTDAHAALAEVLAAAEPARAAWHRAAVAGAPDEELAAALERAGADARARGAPSWAAHALGRAAELSEDADGRARRRLAAAQDHLLAGELERADAVARVALPDTVADRLTRSDLERVRHLVAMRWGRLDAAAASLARQAEEVAADDPRRAADLLLDACLRHRIVGDYDALLRTGARARELAGDTDAEGVAGADVLRGAALVLTGQVEEGDALVARHEERLVAGEAVRLIQEIVTTAADVSMWTERFDRAERILAALIQRARDANAVSTLIYPLLLRAELALRRGRLAPAYAEGTEALQLARDTRQYSLIALTAGRLSRVEAVLGREDACREHARLSLQICDAVGAAAMSLWAHGALGTLELTLGRPDQALVPLGACGRIADELGLVEPTVIQWAADHAEALVRTGAVDEARAASERLEREPASAWATAAAARVRGLVADGDEAAGELERSVVLFERAGNAFEAARSRLCLGERLRRARRRLDARGPLNAALAVFERAGAEPWVDRTRQELRATGQALAATNDGRAAEVLTPHELRVAMLVAEGRTNPEVAAELFVTRKTVEYHLSQIYRKLGIRSRVQLAQLIAAA